jgi:hypothetical protein
MCAYIYVYICVCIHICMYTYDARHRHHSWNITDITNRITYTWDGSKTPPNPKALGPAGPVYICHKSCTAPVQSAQYTYAMRHVPYVSWGTCHESCLLYAMSHVSAPGPVGPAYTNMISLYSVYTCMYLLVVCTYASLGRPALYIQM